MVIGPLLVIAAGAVLGVRAAAEPLHAGRLSPWALMGDFDRALEENDFRGAAQLILQEARQIPVWTAATWEELDRKKNAFNSAVKERHTDRENSDLLFIRPLHGLYLMRRWRKQRCQGPWPAHWGWSCKKKVLASVIDPSFEPEPRREGFLAFSPSNNPGGWDGLMWMGHRFDAWRDLQGSGGLDVYEVHGVPSSVWEWLKEEGETGRLDHFEFVPFDLEFVPVSKP